MVGEQDLLIGWCFIAAAHTRMTTGFEADALEALPLPDLEAQRRYKRLVGVDALKRRLAQQLSIVMQPSLIDQWAKEKGTIDLANLLKERTPMFILEGDVGCGKTELAETIGDEVARSSGIEITLYRMSLTSRGTGLVGEMTRLITAAFSRVRADARQWTDGKRARAGGLLFIDEGDALAQSREISEMHHEDRAGVNALIRAIDDLARAGLPVAVLLATNRVAALDPAIRRRAADVLHFERPNEKARRELLEQYVGALLKKSEIDDFVSLTGERNGWAGYTYSDLRQRLIPAIVLRSINESKAIDLPLVKSVVADEPPTPPFGARVDI